MRSHLPTLVCFCVIATCGCAVDGLHDDQDRLRSALLDLCTDQVMDNLVRASNGLPIIHLDYTNANTQLTVDVNGSVGETGIDSHSNTLKALALSPLLVTRTFANTIASSLGMSRTNQVAVTATPVTTTNQVYDAYLSFLTIPGSLQVTPTAPPAGAAHICRRFRGEYYWIPLQFRDQYFELAAITTAQRTKSLLEPDDSYSVTLIGFGANPPTNSQPAPGKSTMVVVKIDRAVPVWAGGTATLAGGRVLTVRPPEPNGSNEADFVSDTFKLILPPDMSPGDLNFPIPISLLLKQPPPPPTTKDLLNRIPFRTPQVEIGKASASATGSSSPPPLPAPAPAALPSPEPGGTVSSFKSSVLVN